GPSPRRWACAPRPCGCAAGRRAATRCSPWRTRRQTSTSACACCATARAGERRGRTREPESGVTWQLEVALLVAAAVLLVAVGAVRLSTRLGVPSLLVYLALGVVLGEAGIG